MFRSDDSFLRHTRERADFDALSDLESPLFRARAFSRS
jgi:hypothetical protein